MIHFYKSRKILSFITLFMFWLTLIQVTEAQITLEHTFSNESVNFNLGIVNGAANYHIESVTYPENSFFSTKIVDNSYKIKIYNSDYSLNTYNTYQFIPPSGYKVASVSPSKKLFNSDNNYEFIVTFSKTSYSSYDNEYYRSILYDINGNVIKDFGTGSSLTVYPYLFIIDKQYKLMVIRTTYDTEHNSKTNTEIYSVPGTYSSLNVSEYKINKNQTAYPNPTHYNITLPYQLKQGEKSEMRIFNINGQLVESKQIDFLFDKILLDVSEYSKGIYFYEVNGISSEFVVN